MKIIPISLKTANNYVTDHHRHHKKCAGCKFCIGLQNDGDELIGVAICGRPVSRYLDDGWTLEINRLCTDGTYNACSKLYGACIRIARNMGYKKIITYTLASEPGLVYVPAILNMMALQAAKCGQVIVNVIMASPRK